MPLPFPNLQVFLVDQYRTAYPGAAIVGEFPETVPPPPAPPASPDSPMDQFERGIKEEVKEETKEVKKSFSSKK